QGRDLGKKVGAPPPPSTISKEPPSVPNDDRGGNQPQKAGSGAVSGDRTASEEEARSPQVFPDPFQARLVDRAHLVFYRKVWIERRQYLQGFAVDLEKFYSWLMDQSFANSELPEFALARLELSQRPLAQYGIVDLPIEGLAPLFRRAFGYPL